MKARKKSPNIKAWTRNRIYGQLRMVEGALESILTSGALQRQEEQMIESLRLDAKHAAAQVKLNTQMRAR